MSDCNSTTSVEYREISRFVGYRFGSDGSVWSRWKKVPISKDGGFETILSDSWDLLNGTIHRKAGYRLVALKAVGCDRWLNFLVHRLILEAFVGPCPEGMEACHDPDRDRLNCRLDNLRWDTHAANVADRAKHGTNRRGERHGMAKLRDAQIDEIARLLREGMTQRAVALRFNVSQSTIYLINRGKIWKHIR